jgi:hypothetical protein
LDGSIGSPAHGLHGDTGGNEEDVLGVEGDVCSASQNASEIHRDFGMARDRGFSHNAGVRRSGCVIEAARESEGLQRRKRLTLMKDETSGGADLADDVHHLGARH